MGKKKGGVREGMGEACWVGVMLGVKVRGNSARRERGQEQGMCALERGSDGGEGEEGMKLGLGGRIDARSVAPGQCNSTAVIPCNKRLQK